MPPRIHNDLAPRQTAIPQRATHHKTSGRVDQKPGILIDPVGRQDRADDVFNDGLSQVSMRNFWIMLGRNHHRVDANGLAIRVTKRDLAFRIRA